MKNFVILFLLILFGLGCGTTPKNVRTVRYDDLMATGKSIKGTASWYGKRFHGRKTANGERYNMHELTAAHKKLPFGTLLEVTNLTNNKRIIVRVNDRGPYAGRRVLDLSYAAAKKLDFVSNGTTKVLARIMVKKPNEVAHQVEEEPSDPLASLLEQAIESDDE